MINNPHDISSVWVFNNYDMKTRNKYITSSILGLVVGFLLTCGIFYHRYMYRDNYTYKNAFERERKIRVAQEEVLHDVWQYDYTFWNDFIIKCPSYENLDTLLNNNCENFYYVE